MTLPEKGPNPQVNVEDVKNECGEKSFNWHNVHKPLAIDYQHAYPKEWPTEIQRPFGLALDWARKHAERKHTKLSVEQKRDLISSLDGYCIQNDFDTIVSRLPRESQNDCLTHLVHLLLVKECISRFFTNPFWYLVPNPRPVNDGDDKGNLAANASEFGAQILELFERMREYHKLGYDMIAHRDSVADKICEEVLGQELVKLLLRSTVKCDLDRAFLDMQKVFRSAAELSVKISCNLERLEFKTLNNLGHAFHHPSAEIELAEDYGGAEKEHCFDDRQILFLEFPAMYCCGDLKDPFYKGILHKAVVYVEDVD
ncbi:uncharacterized protein BO88DRAFT_416394 [Aspergillus vadensis CBS 113365]|uniref:Uncharacterized protein n=1 Tax=Aspergillus vadensis (strain CBS 113365 / IMI 142717 / IBT 24658) TaxID=1448311 RepID=A0A319BY16_ASPVC|nr:hypothetical protein BO88DRAFT_416394 [Aspergillus vadensis CBS 113365]PYH68028.1 hypothetical protein BO88DRAFT_416394 [Aspergillus vadensis CBS 113365]